MKIEFKLDDPTKCNGCPCCFFMYELYTCQLSCDFYIGSDGERPQECIDKKMTTTKPMHATKTTIFQKTHTGKTISMEVGINDPAEPPPKLQSCKCFCDNCRNNCKLVMSDGTQGE